MKGFQFYLKRRRALLTVAVLLTALLIWGVDYATQNALGIPKAEYKALVALYRATDGPHWLRNTNWLTSNTPWFGVKVSRGHVYSLHLEARQRYQLDTGTFGIEHGACCQPFESIKLKGQIPKELGNLTRLVQLSLSQNELAGQIPHDLEKLTNLEQLSLDNNQLSGEIPAGLGKLVKLRKLDLSKNQLTGQIPPDLGKLNGLYSLNLQDNRLTGQIPSELGHLGALIILNLQNNQLVGEVPSEVMRLRNVSDRFDLSGNELTGATSSLTTEIATDKTPNVTPRSQSIKTEGIIQCDTFPVPEDASDLYRARGQHRNCHCPKEILPKVYLSQAPLTESCPKDMLEIPKSLISPSLKMSKWCLAHSLCADQSLLALIEVDNNDEHVVQLDCKADDISYVSFEFLNSGKMIGAFRSFPFTTKECLFYDGGSIKATGGWNYDPISGPSKTRRFLLAPDLPGATFADKRPANPFHPQRLAIVENLKSLLIRIVEIVQKKVDSQTSIGSDLRKAEERRTTRHSGTSVYLTIAQGNFSLQARQLAIRMLIIEETGLSKDSDKIKEALARLRSDADPAIRTEAQRVFSY